MLKCARLRWVCAPQYRLAGTSTSPRLSNSRRTPVASRPIGRSRISGISSLASVMTCRLPIEARDRRPAGQLGAPASGIPIDLIVESSPDRRTPAGVSVLAAVHKPGSAELEPGLAAELGVIALKPGRPEIVAGIAELGL